MIIFNLDSFLNFLKESGASDSRAPSVIIFWMCCLVFVVFLSVMSVHAAAHYQKDKKKNIKQDD